MCATWVWACGPATMGGAPHDEDTPGSARARADALLSRYGGTQGPTGHAEAGPDGQPVSLASFIGGKAKAPRLGQLAGDGRTSVPEAALADEPTYRGLPGIAKPDGSMAKMMEMRHRELFPDEAAAKEAQATADQSDAGATEVPKDTEAPKDDNPTVVPATADKEGDETATPATPDAPSDAPHTPAMDAPDVANDKPDTSTSEAHADQRTEVPAPAPARDAHTVPAKGPTPSPTASGPTAPLAKRSTAGKRIVVLISGSGSNLQAIIDATCGASPTLQDAQIVRVISNRMNAYGLQRAKNVDPPIPTKVHSLKTFQNRNPGKTREDYDLVLADYVLGDGALPDLIVLAGFMHIVSETFLSALGHKSSLASPPTFAKRPAQPVSIINLHPALPGAFDGANAIERAYEAFQKGDIEHTGIMVHEVVAEVDRGAPILVEQVPIHHGEPLDALETRMHAVEHRLIVQAIQKVLADARKEPSDAKAAGASPATAAAPAAPVASASPAASAATDRRTAGPAPRTETKLAYVGPSGDLVPLNTFAPEVYATDLLIAKQGPQSFVWRGAQAPAEIPGAVQAALGDTCRTVHQGAEPVAFTALLQGPLVTRRGARGAARESTELLVFRSTEAGLFVDEMPVTSDSLCSAFSAVLHTPDEVWVWHGKGSTAEQRKRAMQFAQMKQRKVVEMDEAHATPAWRRRFPDTHASGWHWRHFAALSPELRTARLYVSADDTEAVPFTSEALRADRVALLDAGLEIYVLIGRDARGDRARIQAALDRAERLAVSTQTTLGGRTWMRPAVHVLVFPTVVPADLRILSRAPWEDAPLQRPVGGALDAPVLLNVHTLSEARRQLAHPAEFIGDWSNENCLPVGLAPPAARRP